VAQYRGGQAARRHCAGGDLIAGCDLIEQVGAILARAARAEILPRFRTLDAAQVRQKSSAFDIVTEADEAAEAAITSDLRAAFPGAVIVGEEATHRDPALLQAIGSVELAFIVDPIDGTRNFASGLPLFGVMAAATVRGEIVAGVIHDPICRDFAYAVRGGGAWIEREDGTRTALRVAPPVPVAEMEGIVGTTFCPSPCATRSTATSRAWRPAPGSAVRRMKYRLAAAGHCHLLFYNKLMPWDHAAGWLLHREAGGYSAHFDGTPYRPTDLSGGLICAPDETSWRAAHDALLRR
jgi:fructose-1,6-bisphosphatase/inositol monophosphatase family enzyme